MKQWVNSKGARLYLKCSESWLTRLAKRTPPLIERERDGRRRWIYSLASLKHYAANKRPAYRPVKDANDD